MYRSCLRTPIPIDFFQPVFWRPARLVSIELRNQLKDTSASKVKATRLRHAIAHRRNDLAIVSVKSVTAPSWLRKVERWVTSRAAHSAATHRRELIFDSRMRGKHNSAACGTMCALLRPRPCPRARANPLRPIREQ